MALKGSNREITQSDDKILRGFNKKILDVTQN